MKWVNVLILQNDVLKNEKRIQNEPRVYYSLIKYKQKGSYDIMENISENVTLAQLMDSIGNVNHAIIVVGYWIFDSNYKKSLVLNMSSLDNICDPSVGE